MVTLYAGSLVGVCYFIADLPAVGRWLLGSKMHPGFSGLVTDASQGLGIPFMLVGPLIAAWCIGIYVLVSLRTPAMDQVAVSAVCWHHRLAFLKGKFDSASDPRIVALVLFVLVAFLYWIMR